MSSEIFTSFDVGGGDVVPLDDDDVPLDGTVGGDVLLSAVSPFDDDDVMLLDGTVGHDSPYVMENETKDVGRGSPLSLVLTVYVPQAFALKNNVNDARPSLSVPDEPDSVAVPLFGLRLHVSDLFLMGCEVPSHTSRKLPLASDAPLGT